MVPLIEAEGAWYQATAEPHRMSPWVEAVKAGLVFRVAAVAGAATVTKLWPPRTWAPTPSRVTP